MQREKVTLNAEQIEQYRKDHFRLKAIIRLLCTHGIYQSEMIENHVKTDLNRLIEEVQYTEITDMTNGIQGRMYAMIVG